MEKLSNLRDQFAGQAMQAIAPRYGSQDFTGVARDAYEMADAMLAERDRYLARHPDPAPVDKPQEWDGKYVFGRLYRDCMGNIYWCNNSDSSDKFHGKLIGAIDQQAGAKTPATAADLIRAGLIEG